MSRSGFHDAIVDLWPNRPANDGVLPEDSTDYDRQVAHRRNRFQETPSQILIRSESTDINQFAHRLNGLIEFRCKGLIDSAEFISNLVALGLTVGKAQELDAAARAKRQEVMHEYAVCQHCQQVDGNHTEDCLG